MRTGLVLVAAMPIAAACWWGLYQFSGRVEPGEPGAQAAFFILLFLALWATLAPLAAFLNRRFAPGAARRAPWRFLRHSFWVTCCFCVFAWLQMHRAFNLGFAFIIGLIFLAIEIFVVRVRGEA